MSNNSQCSIEFRGETVNDRWRVDEPIGSGDYGWVYSATDLSGTHPSVVIKFARDDLEDDFADAPDSLAEEYDVLRHLNRVAPHLRIPIVYEHGTHGATDYVVMKKLGLSMQDWLLRNYWASNQLNLHICNRVFTTIRLLHQLNVAHRDIALRNIVFGNEGHDRGDVYVIDFASSSCALWDAQVDDLEELCHAMVIMLRTGMDIFLPAREQREVTNNACPRNRTNMMFQNLEKAYVARERLGTPIPPAVQAIVRLVFETNETNFDLIGSLLRHALDQARLQR